MLLLASLLPGPEAGAVQSVEGSERAHVAVAISAREQNRLAIEGRRIGMVVPSQKGALSYIRDEAAGALYFTLAGDVPGNGSVTLFVTEEGNPWVNYKLILQPRAIAGEEILIKPAAALPEPAPRRGADGRALAYQRHAKELVLRLADEDSQEVQAVNQVIPLWREARLVLLARLTDGDVVGEKYRLTNVSDSAMRLAEPELYRRGVIAVAVEHQSLPVGGATLVFVVRGRQDDE